MIETRIKKLRDPFILVENGVYEAYGTLDGGHGMIFISLEGCSFPEQTHPRARGSAGANTCQRIQRNCCLHFKLKKRYG